MSPVVRAHARAWLPIVLLVLAAVGFLVYGSLRESDPSPRLSSRIETKLGSGFVTRVFDGDTIRLADERRIRLVQIDAPELDGDACYAEEARLALERLTPIGAQISPRLDAALDVRDRFGRLLAYVFKDGVNVNVRLVEIGAAAPYFYRGERGRHGNTLMIAARRARAAKRGLWRACPATRLDPNRQVETRP